MDDPISRQDAINIHCKLCGKRGKCNPDICADMEVFLDIPQRYNEIVYADCSNALLKMWMDSVLTDSEYKHIAEKLNNYWRDKIKNVDK